MENFFVRSLLAFVRNASLWLPLPELYHSFSLLPDRCNGRAANAGKSGGISPLEQSSFETYLSFSFSASVPMKKKQKFSRTDGSDDLDLSPASPTRRPSQYRTSHEPENRNRTKNHLHRLTQSKNNTPELAIFVNEEISRKFSKLVLPTRAVAFSHTTGVVCRCVEFRREQEARLM